MSLTVILAGKLASALTNAFAPHVKKLLLGSPAQRAAEKVIVAAARQLAVTLPEDPGISNYVVRWLGTGEVAQLLVDSAFPGGPPLDAETLQPLLIDAGYDPTTSYVDVVEQALILGHLIAKGLRDEVDKPDSPLSRRFANAHLDDISARLPDTRPVQADKVDSLVPALPQPFIGRDADLDKLRSLLDPDACDLRPRPIVIQGWPGVGKSSVAAAVARDPIVDGWFPDGILWATLSERPGKPPDVSGQLGLWLRRLRLDVGPEDESVATKAQLLGGRLRQARMLLIVDDAWSAVDAQPFLVGGPGCATLVTTRIPEVIGGIGGAPYPLRILSDDAALELFCSHARDVVAESRDAVLILVGELEGLPLAVRVAAGLLAAEHCKGWGVDRLLAELREGSRLLREKAPADRSDLAMGTTPTVAALLARSTDRLPPRERKRFARLGAFASRPATFDVAAIAAQWETPDPYESIRILVDRGLLAPDGRGRFQMHALLAHHALSILRGR